MNNALLKTYTGAKLNRIEVATVRGMDGTTRCVLALMPGWKKSELESPQCTIAVIRNFTDSQGNLRPDPMAAKLVQFDEATGLAAIFYPEKFDARFDSGYRLARADAASGEEHALLTYGRSAQELEIQSSAPSGDQSKHGKLDFPNLSDDIKADESPLEIASRDTLVGFVADYSQTPATVIPAAGFKLNYQFPTLNPVAIAFGAPLSNGKVQIAITVEDSEIMKKLSAATLRIVESPTPEEIAEAAAGRDFLPTGNSVLESHLYKRDLPTNVVGDMPCPLPEKDECTYLLQVGPTPFQGLTIAPAYSRPFLVKLRNEGGKLVTAVTGIKDLNAEISAQAKAATKFPVESEIEEVHEIAGGREVLLKLKDAPYWKRFSMTKNDWLPLPQTNLSNSKLAGNLTALFILDRGTGVLRKYGLEDIKLLAEIKLSQGNQYVTVAAGCNSQRAPVHIIHTGGAFSLSSDMLQPADLLAAAPKSRGLTFSQDLPSSKARQNDATGDGLSVASLFYNNQSLGLEPRYADVERYYMPWGQGVGVSAAFMLKPSQWLETLAPSGETKMTEAVRSQSVAATWLAPNCPVIFREFGADARSTPPRDARIEMISYFDSKPFAEAPVPELNDPNLFSSVLQEHRQAAFDPYSLRLGVSSADHKTWTTHPVAALPQRTQPVLLNWPESTVARGEAFHFKPVILGDAKITAEVTGSIHDIKPRLENDEVRFDVGADEPLSMILLTLKVAGKDAAISYPIPLHISGPEIPVAFSRENAPADSWDLHGTFKALSRPPKNATLLPTTTHVFTDPVSEVLGPVAGHLLLVSEGRRVDLFSLQTRKVVLSIPSSANSSYFAGADALFEYNAASRALTRIGVPDGVREKSITMPANLRLQSVAAGNDPASPITLILEEIQSQESARIGNITVTETRFDRNAVALDSRLLQAGHWAQPKLFMERGERAITSNPYNFGGGVDDHLKRLPASHNGQFITLPEVFMVLSGGISMTAKYPGGHSDAYDVGTGNHSLGSISGMTASGNGKYFVGGSEVEWNNATPNTTIAFSPCGRYRLMKVLRVGQLSDARAIEIRTLENNQPLFQVGRLALFREDFEDYGGARIPQQMMMLGDNGPLAILAGGGKALQLVDLDIPRLAKTLNPTSFHVTSQAPACMMEGSAMQYQIQVNNPEIVTAYKLRDPVEGASISSAGLLHYTAPAKVDGPVKTVIPIEIAGKDNEVVLHEITVFVLPHPKAAGATQPSKPLF